MALSCEYILNIRQRIFLLRRLDGERYEAIHYFSRSSFAAILTQAAIYQDLWSGWKKKKEMKTHLLGIHNTSIFSGESKDGQTLNNRTTHASMVPATTDHLMPSAVSNMSKSTMWKAHLIKIPAYRAHWLKVITSYWNWYEVCFWLLINTHGQNEAVLIHSVFRVWICSTNNLKWNKKQNQSTGCCYSRKVTR